VCCDRPPTTTPPVGGGGGGPGGGGGGGGGPQKITSAAKCLYRLTFLVDAILLLSKWFSQA
jgi:hypothetical protein